MSIDRKAYYRDYYRRFKKKGRRKPDTKTGKLRSFSKPAEVSNTVVSFERLYALASKLPATHLSAEEVHRRKEVVW